MTTASPELRSISAVFFFPYLSLAEPIVTREWGLGGLSVGKPEWRESPVGDWAAAFIRKLRGPNGEAGVPATMAIARPVDGQQPSGEALVEKLNALATAVQFAAILTNCTYSAVRWEQEHLVTLENGELRVVEVNTDTRTVAWQEGFIRRRTMSVPLDDPDAVFHAPPTLFAIPTIAPDLAALSSVYGANMRAVEGDEAAQRILGAIHWYLEAWRNSRSALIRDRIFYLKTGLDALVGTDKTQRAIPLLRGLYERGAARRTDILWTASTQEFERTDSRGTTYRQPAFDHWYWALSDQRNLLIHESSEPSWQHEEPGSIYAGGYFETAERVLRELILLALNELTTEER